MIIDKKIMDKRLKKFEEKMEALLDEYADLDERDVKDTLEFYQHSYSK